MATTKQALETLIIAPGKLMWRLSCMEQVKSDLSGNFYGIHIYFRTFSSQNVANHWRFFVGCWFKRDCSVPGQLLGITGAAQNFALPITTFLGLLGVWLATFVFDRCLSAGSRGPGCSLHHLMVIPYEIQWFIIISSIKTRGFWGDTM